MFAPSAFSLSRRRLLAGALAASALLGGCASVPVLAPMQPMAPASARALLAPTGVLRVAVYPGSPTSLVEQAPPERMRGISVDLGRALAARLGVPAQIAVYPRLTEALAALQRGDADLTVTNATAERASLVDFAPTLVHLELGVLVPAEPRVTSVEALDQPGVTVGVSQGKFFGEGAGKPSAAGQAAQLCDAGRGARGAAGPGN